MQGNSAFVSAPAKPHQCGRQFIWSTKDPNRSRDHRIVGNVAVGDEDAIQTPGYEDSVGLRRQQVEFVNEVPGQLVDIGDQFSARYESKIQPTQVALNGDVQPLFVGDDGHRVVGGRFGALEIPAYSARGRSRSPN